MPSSVLDGSRLAKGPNQESVGRMQLRHRREWQGVRAEIAALMADRQRIRKSRTDMKDDRKEFTKQIRAIEEDFRARCAREVAELKGPAAMSALEEMEGSAHIESGASSGVQAAWASIDARGESSTPPELPSGQQQPQVASAVLSPTGAAAMEANTVHERSRKDGQRRRRKSGVAVMAGVAAAVHDALGSFSSSSFSAGTASADLDQASMRGARAGAAADGDGDEAEAQAGEWRTAGRTPAAAGAAQAGRAGMKKKKSRRGGRAYKVGQASGAGDSSQPGMGFMGMDVGSSFVG